MKSPSAPDFKNMVNDYNPILLNKQALTKNVYLFEFGLKDQEIRFVAGQYLLLKVRDHYRQFSIATKESVTDRFEMIVEIFETGLASSYLSTLSVGGQAFFRGPAGVFTLRDSSHDKIFLATGTGIAPIKSMIESYLEKGGQGRLHLYWGLRHKTDIYLQENFLNLKKNYPNFDFSICLSQEKQPIDNLFKSGRNTAVFDWEIKQHGLNILSYDYYLCGSPKSVEGMEEFLLGYSVGKEQIYSEKFSVHPR